MDQEKRQQVKETDLLLPSDLEDFEEETPVVKPIKETKSDDLFTIEDAIKQIEENEKNDNKTEEESSKEDDLSLTQEIKLDDLEKPIINVDKDSVVVNENVITDDEYYDDFFE